MLNRNFKKKYNVNLRSGFCILVYPFAPRDYGMCLFDKFSWKTVIGNFSLSKYKVKRFPLESFTREQYCSWCLNAASQMALQLVRCSQWCKKCIKSWTLYTLISACIFSILFFTYLLRTDKENLFDNQELPKLVIVSFILMALVFDSRVIMWGEIVRGRSL